MKKFLNIEIIICFLDHTWNTDYVTLPYPDGGEEIDDTRFKAIQQWGIEEQEKAEQRGSVGPTVTYVGVYNYNWDEPVDENGDLIDE